MAELPAVESFLNDVVIRLNQTALIVQRLEAEVAGLKATVKRIAPAYYADRPESQMEATRTDEYFDHPFTD